MSEPVAVCVVAEPMLTSPSTYSPDFLPPVAYTPARINQMIRPQFLIMVDDIGKDSRPWLRRVVVHWAPVLGVAVMQLVEGLGHAF